MFMNGAGRPVAAGQEKMVQDLAAALVGA